MLTLKKIVFEINFFKIIFLAYFIMLGPMNVFFGLIFLKQGITKVSCFFTRSFCIAHKIKRSSRSILEKKIVNVH
jgi:hypothetical protein